ncbi:unnamed protein product [Ascophyllum nodosum]
MFADRTNRSLLIREGVVISLYIIVIGRALCNLVGSGAGTKLRKTVPRFLKHLLTLRDSRSEDGKMEEDPTPIPSMGMRKALILDDEGVIRGEETNQDASHTNSGMYLEKIVLCKVHHLSETFTPTRTPNHEITVNTLGSPTFYNKLLGPKDCIIYEHVRDQNKPPTAKAFLRAGPRGKLHFNPTTVRGAIVTCGGLCPGLNSVIHHLVTTLLLTYKADKVFGIRGGFAGFYTEANPPIDLTVRSVELLQHQPGSMLGSSRGGFDLEKIIKFVVDNKVNQLFIIGGDGTHRGANRIANECIERGLNISVSGIPKTIDNDLDLIDRSFGFITSVEAAQAAIQAATTEAKCNIPNGVGVVKLMGRSAGYIAAYSTLASGAVDLCLIPEAPIVLYGANGCLPHIMKRVKDKGYAVVVVAEGAGEELLGTSTATDPSGNKRLPAIGEFMKKIIEKAYAEKGEQCNVKYIDPSYMIRSVPANAFDQIYCMQLAQNAVHGSMAGYTAFSSGVINNRTVYIPIPELVENSPKNVNIYGRTWERVLTITRQPNTVEPREPRQGTNLEVRLTDMKLASES